MPREEHVDSLHELPYAPQQARPMPLARGATTRRPGLWGGIGCLIMGAGMAVAAGLSDREDPARLVRRWQTALVRADMLALRHEARLGMVAWTRAIVREQGERDFARVLGIYDRAAEQGRRELNRISSAVDEGGRAAFGRLSYAQQYAVLHQSHDAWVCEHGRGHVPAVSATPCAVLYATPPPEALLQQLGTTELDADEQSLLANRAASDPAVAGDAVLARLAQRRSTLGARALGRVIEQVQRAGEHELRRLEAGERDRIDRESISRFLREQGFAALPERDRTRVGSSDALAGDNTALATRLGLEGLTAEERGEVGASTRAEFSAARDRYIEDKGTRLARALLEGMFRTSHCEVVRVEVAGNGGRDLLRRNVASVTLRWRDLGGGAALQPDRVELRWSSLDGAWRVGDVHWEPVPGRGAAETADESEGAAAPAQGEAPARGSL